MNIDILAVGSLNRVDGVLKDAHSTSTLIRTGERNIVVDTSSEYLRPAIKESLKQLRLLPKDIDTIVLTHSHFDHTSNNDLFPKAKIYIREEERKGNEKGVKEDIELCKGVMLVHTPGHTDGSMSVFVEGDRKYAIAGDAIPLAENYRRMLPPRINTDPELAIKSIKSISAYADVIIPGHGLPFPR